MGRIRNAVRAAGKVWRVATKYSDEDAAAFYRNRWLLEVRVTLELFDKYYDGKSNYEFEYGYLQHALERGRDYWGYHIDAEEADRFKREWRNENLYERIVACDEEAFSGYSVDFSAWLAKVMGKIVVYADTGYLRLAAFNNEYNTRVLAWSGWERDGVSWIED